MRRNQRPPPLHYFFIWVFVHLPAPQVIDPYSGEALGEAPPLKGEAKYLVWEFPRMGPQVMLRMPKLQPGKEVRYEFMAFGGSYIDEELRADIGKCGPVSCDREAGEHRPCADISVRIGLTVKPNGSYKFDPEWEVEKMPGRRCIFDGVLLPNGHVVLIGGQRVRAGVCVCVGGAAAVWEACMCVYRRGREAVWVACVRVLAACNAACLHSLRPLLA